MKKAKSQFRYSQDIEERGGGKNKAMVSSRKKQQPAIYINKEEDKTSTYSLK
jgi:hypothetical protein